MGNCICAKIRRHKHYLIGATSVFCFATNVLFLGATDTSVEFFCLRGFCFQAVVLSAVVSWRSRWSDLSVGLYGERHLHLARALAGCGAYAFMLKAAEMIDMDDIMNISASSPALVAFLSCVFLREKLKWGEVTTYLATIGGVLTLCRPSAFFENEDDDGDEVQGSAWALAGSLCLACTYVTQRMIKRTPVAVTLLYNALVAVLVLAPVVAVTGTWRTSGCFSYPMLAVSSAIVVVGNVYQVEVSRVDLRTRLAILCAVDVPFTVVTEFHEFDELPWWACYAASALVTACVGLVLLIQKKERRKQKDERGDRCQQDTSAPSDDHKQHGGGGKTESVAALEDPKCRPYTSPKGASQDRVPLCDRDSHTKKSASDRCETIALTAISATVAGAGDCATVAVSAAAELLPSRLVVEHYLQSPVRETVL